MPSIKYKKKTYAGATFPVLEMTKAEYDALPEAKKMDGTVYMITDDTGGWEAENASYDNTTSGLTATNVQAALDEVVRDKVIWGYKSSVSLNSVKDPGLYFCQNCTDVPLSVFGEWSVEVIASGKGENAGTIMQIAKPTIRSGVEFTRYFTNNAWTPWAQAGRTVAINDNLSTVKYYPKPGSASYGAFIVMGTYYGVGSTAVLCSVENGSLGSMINMFTGQTYSGGLTISFGVENGVGWIGLKTAQSGTSVGCIIG